ncbi:MAG: hypothetical protein HY904_12975 [Deltaproteobacteria bacterium]|nr:hypothetical protein [Deltaproteobacteria bacterium]
MKAEPKRIVIAVCAVALAASCLDRVQQAERFLEKENHLQAFRASRALLRQEGQSDDDVRRMRTVLILAARAILGAPDTESKEEAFELFEGLPPGSEERARAAQRVLRVMARHADVKDLGPALAALEPEMGEEPAVRSNLRLIAEQTRGTQASLWAARVVVERWPEDQDRWVDLALSQSAVRAFADAERSLLEAEKRLDTYCVQLPKRVAEYDRVRRQSAYGTVELKRCQQGLPLIALRLQAARHQVHPPPEVEKRYAETRGAADTACPRESAPAASPGENLVLLSPQPDAAWVDGKAVVAPAFSAPAGMRRVAWRSSGKCRQQELDIPAAGVLAVRTIPIDLPAVAQP